MAQNLRTIAIIQARMGSTRLPGKTLADIAGKPMLVRIIERTAAAKLIDDIVVATTTADEDDILVRFVEKNSTCKTYRGSASNVLDRYYQCARQYAADVVVRITADDPLKDAAIIDRAIELQQALPAIDYCSNTISPTYPEGLDVEVFSYQALAISHKEAALQSEMEHVTPFIYKHPERFGIREFKFERNLSDWRWTVDRPEDLRFANAVYTHFHDQPLVSYIDVIDWLDKNPLVREINADIVRREGYLKSLKSDESEQR
jgi:spore coat polysaccharide biosynthesis protein SpsF (cytidylyltransferase family)